MAGFSFRVHRSLFPYLWLGQTGASKEFGGLSGRSGDVSRSGDGRIKNLGNFLTIVGDEDYMIDHVINHMIVRPTLRTSMLLPLKLVGEDVVRDRKIAAFLVTWPLLAGTIETSSSPRNSLYDPPRVPSPKLFHSHPRERHPIPIYESPKPALAKSASLHLDRRHLDRNVG
jgi:hypothetical protein